ncbi:hypothetical protein niasHT_017585 [Heterodera trifolii]|uniref:Galectin domain-containing protein n=1 Tax=Heterodera trifolii TaxID=157864 RepID=A0ABD2KUJ4_9BILA
MRVIIHLSFLLLAFSIVLLTDDFPEATNSGPLYLCEERSREAHFETEYVALDQCTRWGTAQLRHNSFALRFQLTGKCENGILICYLGSLDPSGANWAYGMSPEIQFQVPNHQESKVAEECLEYQKKFDKNKNQIASHWHGVRVSAPKEFGGIMIELSISKEKYNLSDTQNFNIEFGNPKDLMTKITDEMGREIKFSKDEAIRNAYLSNKIKRDAKLRNYTGLWMLGLDVLPMNNQDKMQLHVYRDCGCEMHAWFVHPSDEVPPLLSDHPVVSVDCPTTVHEADSHQFALPEPVGVGRAIRMRQRLNKNPEGIELRFGNEKQKDLLMLRVDKPPYGIINISTAGGFKRIKGGKDGEESEAGIIRKQLPDKKASMGHHFKAFESVENDNEWEDKYLDVELVVHNYFYEVKIGDRKSVKYFPKPSEWWTEEDKLDNFTQIEIAGDVYPSSIEVPEVKERPESAKSKRQSWSKKFENALNAGDTVVIRGKTGRPEMGDKQLSLSFYLMHNSPEFNRYVSKVAWFLFQKDGNLTIGHYNFAEKFQFGSQPNMSLFNPNEPFEMRIETVQQEGEEFGQLNITISTPNGIRQTIYRLVSMTFRDINFINIVGSLELFEAPFVVAPEDGIKRKQNGWPVFPLLVAGDSLTLEGKLRDDAKFLNIELLHDSPVSNPYFGNVVLQIVFNLEQGQMFLNTFTSKLVDDLMKSFPSKMFPAEQFKIEIHVAFNEYKIFVYGALVATYEHILPPWAVSYINFHGDFHNISAFVLNRTQGIFCAAQLRSLDVPLVAEIPEQRMLQSRDYITINGTITKKSPQIIILLLNEALESYNSVAPSVIYHLLNGTSNMVGTIVVRAIFTTDLDGNVTIHFSYNEEVEEHHLKSALTEGQNFHLKITMRRRPMFHLDGFGKFMFGIETMPMWAIQYIRIEGDLKLHEQPRIEFFEKKGHHK